MSEIRFIQFGTGTGILRTVTVDVPIANGPSVFSSVSRRFANEFLGKTDAILRVS
jgi:hypothetical protein